MIFSYLTRDPKERSTSSPNKTTFSSKENPLVIDPSNLQTRTITPGDSRRSIADKSWLLKTWEDPRQIFLYLGAFNATFNPQREGRPADHIHPGDEIILPSNRTQLDAFIAEYETHIRSPIDLEKLKTNTWLEHLRRSITSTSKPKEFSKEKESWPTIPRERAIIDLIPADLSLIADTVKYRNDKQSRLYPTLNPIPEKFQDTADRCASYVIKRIEQYHGYDMLKFWGLIDFNGKQSKLIDAWMISGQLVYNGKGSIPSDCDLSSLTQIQGDAITYDKTASSYFPGLQAIYNNATKPSSYSAVIPMHNAFSTNTAKVITDHQIAEQLKTKETPNTLTLNTHVAHVEQSQKTEVTCIQPSTAYDLIAEHLYQQIQGDTLVGTTSLEQIKQHISLIPAPLIDGKPGSRTQSLTPGQSVSFDDVRVSHLVHGVVYRHNLAILIAHGQFTPINLTVINWINTTIQDKTFDAQKFDLGERALDTHIYGKKSVQKQQLIDRYIQQYKATSINQTLHASYAEKMVSFLVRTNLRNGFIKPGKMLPLFDWAHKPNANDNHLLKKSWWLEQPKPIDLKTDIFDKSENIIAVANSIPHQPSTMIIAKTQLLCQKLGYITTLSWKWSDLSSALEKIGKEKKIQRERTETTTSLWTEEQYPGDIILNKNNITKLHQLYTKEKNIQKPQSLWVTEQELNDQAIKRPPSFHRWSKIQRIHQACLNDKIFDQPQQFDGKKFLATVSKAQKERSETTKYTIWNLYDEKFVFDTSMTQTAKDILTHLNTLTNNPHIKSIIFWQFIEETGKRSTGYLNRAIGWYEKRKDRWGKQLSNNPSVGPFQLRVSTAQKLMNTYMSPQIQQTYLKTANHLKKIITNSAGNWWALIPEDNIDIKTQYLLEHDTSFATTIAYYHTLDNMRQIESRNTKTQPIKSLPTNSLPTLIRKAKQSSTTKTA